MAFLELNNINCPQYLDFHRIQDCDSISETNSSCYTAKDNVEPNSIDRDVSDSGLQYCHESSRMFVTMSSPYSVNNSYQESEGETDTSYGKENFLVNRPQNLLCDPYKNKKSETRQNNRTVVKPFNLTEGRKRKRDNSEDLIPLAEQVIAFQKKTPKRFHTSGKKEFQPTKHWSPQLVRPQSPNLQAAKRRRSIHFLSKEEQEAKEVEEIKTYKFRARPLNKNVLKNPRLPKTVRKLPTRPKEFLLKTAQRAAENSSKMTDDTPFEFHARPVPKAILEGPTDLKEKAVIPATVPQTPNFALKKRAANWKNESKLNDSAQEFQKFKAAPAPKASTSHFAIKHDKKKRTEIKPFSFDIKDKERIAKKDKKIAEVIEEETKPFVFTAQLMPSPTHCPLPALPKKKPTRPQPFNLRTETRTSNHHNSSNSSQESSGFKAQPATILKKPPFIPEKPLKQPIDMEEFELHSTIRASERLKLKVINDEKEKEKELALQKLQEVQEEEERKAILKLRKQIVHKANPVRHYKPVNIKQSEKGLTEPVTPKFRTDQRLQKKGQCG